MVKKFECLSVSVTYNLVKYFKKRYAYKKSSSFVSKAKDCTINPFRA